MLAKGSPGFSEAYAAMRVPKKWQSNASGPKEFDLPDPDLFDYSA